MAEPAYDDGNNVVHISSWNPGIPMRITMHENEEGDEPPLKDGDGGGTFGGMDDAWKKSVDDQLKRGADNFRAALAGGLGAVLTICGLVVGLYVYTGNKSDGLSGQLNNTQVNVAQLRGEQRTGNAEINGRLNQIMDRLPK